MIDKLLELDRDVFIYLNSLGSETYDGLWLVITQFTSWIPIFGIIFYLTFKRLGWKHALLVIGCISLLLLITDQSTNHLFKYRFQRLRPGSDPNVVDLIRAIVKRKSFSFISGHASNSMAVAFFLYRVLHPYIKYMGFFFLWPLIFAYSRIYLGLHYPGDILGGYVWGILMGTLMVYIYGFLRNRFFPEHGQLDHPTNSEPVADGQ